MAMDHQNVATLELQKPTPAIVRPDLTTIRHSLRTAVAAGVSLAVARLFKMPEAYWAPVTTLIIMQSTVGAALNVSIARILGTVLGCVVGAIASIYFDATVI